MLGDPSLFTRTDEVDNSWRFIDQILSAWDRGVSPPVAYAAGTWGPPEADTLIERDGFEWRRL
jgi:glucose-6-phosphate 1-dehydrogenase